MRITLLLLGISLIMTSCAPVQENTPLNEPNLIKNISQDYTEYLKTKLWLEWFPIYGELALAEKEGKQVDPNIIIPPLTQIKEFKILRANLDSESIARVKIEYVKAKLSDGKEYIQTKNEIFEHYKGSWIPKTTADYHKAHSEIGSWK